MESDLAQTRSHLSTLREAKEEVESQLDEFLASLRINPEEVHVNEKEVGRGSYGGKEYTKAFYHK